MTQAVLVPTPGHSATFSQCLRYRYALTRAITPVTDRDAPRSRIAFIMLNPSTADEEHNDPTIRRCIGFARAWGFDDLEIGNLFAYRSTDPDALAAVTDPVGPDNDAALQDIARGAHMIIYAWGSWKGVFKRSWEASRMIAEMQPHTYCLGVTKTGEPAHPLYLAADTQPVPFVRVF